MNREFDNGFDEEEERLRGRSRKRDLGAGAGADSDTMPGGRAGSSRRGINGAGQEVRAGSGCRALAAAIRGRPAWRPVSKNRCSWPGSAA